MTPDPGTPMVPLSVADAARDVSPGCAYTWAELEGAAVPWPATPAARDDNPAVPLSVAANLVADVVVRYIEGVPYGGLSNDELDALSTVRAYAVRGVTT